MIPVDDLVTKKVQHLKGKTEDICRGSGNAEPDSIEEQIDKPELVDSTSQLHLSLKVIQNVKIIEHGYLIETERYKTPKEEENGDDEHNEVKYNQ